jgi:hypothetical protein
MTKFIDTYYALITNYLISTLFNLLGKMLYS